MYLTQGIHRAVVSKPAAVATIFGDRTRTFVELRDRVSRISGGFDGIGITAGDRVAYLGENSDRYLEFYLATWWGGRIAVPLNIRWSAREIAYALEDSATRILIVGPEFAEMVKEIQDLYGGLEHILIAAEESPDQAWRSFDQLAIEGMPADDLRHGYDELAGIFYTGGTSGFPKGVMLSHRNLISGAMAGIIGGWMSGNQPITLHSAPMFHLADVSSLVPTLLLGGTHVIVPRFDPADVLDAIETHSVSDMLLVPALIQLLVDAPEAAGRSLPTLRRMAYGGSPITEAVLDRVNKRWPDVGLCQAYGQTELSPIATLLTADDHGPRGREAGVLRSAGAAAPHTEVAICDESGAPLPCGEVGEIIVRGPNVMMGYWNKPDLTAKALVDQWMHTGDAGYLDDRGYLFVVDRLTDMIITGGENVYSTEVENALSQHPSVASCAVIGVPDEKWGERVHAVVVLQDGAEISPAELRDHVKTLIANYKAPRTIDFVDALPTAGTGKVLKREIRTQMGLKPGLMQ